MRSGGRVVEGARLESEYTPKAYRGFESLPLRHRSASQFLIRNSLWEFQDQRGSCGAVSGGAAARPFPFSERAMRLPSSRIRIGTSRPRNLASRRHGASVVAFDL